MKNIGLILLIAALTSTALPGQSDSPNEYFADNALGNPVIGNAGEYHDGVTYLTYQGPLEDPYVASYNHKTKEWKGPFKAGTSLMGKTPGKKTDNHGKPTLVIDEQGYIHIAFGGHGGTPDIGNNPLGNYHDGKQLHSVSTEPLDISSWQQLDNISPFGTYSQFVKMDNGDIYLFYRHGAHRSNWVYQLSTDNGRTFAAPVSILQTKKTTGTEENPIIYDSWYIRFTRGLNNDVIAAYNYHVCKGPNHDGERHDCYYMKFDTDHKTWHNVKGDQLTLPITKEQADSLTLVYNTGDSWTHNGIARLDREGLPYVTSYEGNHAGMLHGGPKSIKLYSWSGEEWIRKEGKGLPVGAKGEMKIESSNNITMLLGYKENNTGEVSVWKSTNGGKSFRKKEILLSMDKANFDLSYFIRGANSAGQIIAAAKNKKTKVKMYLIGETGPVER